MTSSTWVLFATIATITTLEATKDRSVCKIKGHVTPAMALRQVWLINGKDTIAAMHVGSSFNLAVKPGKYTVWVDAIAPYNDFRMYDIDLFEKHTVELGNIELLQ